MTTREHHGGLSQVEDTSYVAARQGTDSMTALNITFDRVSAPFAPKFGDVQAAVNQAFGAWMSHFDVPQGAVTINVQIGILPSTEPVLGAFSAYAVVSRAGGATDMSGFGAEVASGAPLSAAARTAQLYVSSSWLNSNFADPAKNAAEIQRGLQRAIGQMLGFAVLTGHDANGGVVPPTPYATSQFDRYIRFNGTAEAFAGPNAVAANGGPVAMDYTTIFRPAVGGQVSLESTQQPAYTIQPLDVAILRDTGLPILSDQEVQEHLASRLYQAAFGRAPDAAGLMANSRSLVQGASLNQVAAGFVTSAEFVSRYGTDSSNADFVNTLYQNVLHRAGDAAGAQGWSNALAGGMSRADVLIGFSESNENRNALNANPNLSYSETAEAQTERLYDAAFGRAPDPAGFSNWSHALLNGLTLQQAAASFISGPEYANRYGAAVGSGAYVDALYQNTLHRAADASGRAYWLGLLNGGALGRADLLVAFSEAPEHVSNVIGKDTAVSGGLLMDPSAHLGSIPIIPGGVSG